MRRIKNVQWLLLEPQTKADEDAGRTPQTVRRSLRNLFQRRRRRAGRGVNPTARLRDIIRSRGRG